MLVPYEEVAMLISAVGGGSLPGAFSSGVSRSCLALEAILFAVPYSNLCHFMSRCALSFSTPNEYLPRLTWE